MCLREEEDVRIRILRREGIVMIDVGSTYDTIRNNDEKCRFSLVGFTHYYSLLYKSQTAGFDGRPAVRYG